MPDYLSNPASVPYQKLISRIEAYRSLPSNLLGNLINRESQFRPDAVSNAGAVGMMQLMPIHSDKVDRSDPVKSIQYGAKYLADLHDRFGDWESTLAAYNWGPTNVQRAKRQYGDEWLAHAPQETQDYVAALSPGKGEPYRGPPSKPVNIDDLVSKYRTKDQ